MVSDNVLDRIANRLAKTVTTAEQVKTAVEGVTIQQVIESYGDSRATEASNTARENAVKSICDTGNKCLNLHLVKSQPIKQ